MKNKKGSQVGMILSFIIFITALIIIYGIVGSPFSVSSEKNEAIPFIKNNVINYVSDTIPVVRIYDDSPAGSCIEFNTPSFDFSNPAVFSLKVLPTGVTEVGSSINTGNTSLDSGLNFTKLYYTNSSLKKTKSNTPLGCVTVIPSSISYEKIIFESKIIDLVSMISTNYSEIKKTLKISNEYEFNILFEYTNKTKIGEEKRKVNSNIYANEYKVNYLSNKGEEENGVLIIKIW